MRRIGLIGALVALIALGAAARASASIVHEPANGATYQTTDTIYFDWAWTGGEYATAWIGLARSPDGPWSPRPEVTLSDCGLGTCLPLLSSHDYVPASSIGAGIWYWQLCNSSIYAEDDKCVLAGDIRQLTIIAPPPPPPPPPPPASPPPPSPVVVPCVVPNLNQTRLAVARTALNRAHCALGRVTRPRHVRRHHVLRVARQSPWAGSTEPAWTPVDIALR